LRSSYPRAALPPLHPCSDAFPRSSGQSSETSMESPKLRTRVFHDGSLGRGQGAAHASEERLGEWGSERWKRAK
jgi:hypothetical protein